MNRDFLIINHTQKYKVHFEEKVLQLTTTKRASRYKEPVLLAKNLSTKELIELISKQEVQKVWIYHKNLSSLIETFEDCFKVVYAAGGLVRKKEKILLIYRKKKWDLPKGKIEPEEEFELAAMREVKEETGLKKLKIKNFYRISRHIYVQNDTHYLKLIYWYLMDSVYEGKLSPQFEEQIEKAEWKMKQEILSIDKSQMYVSIRKMLFSYLG